MTPAPMALHSCEMFCSQARRKSQLNVSFHEDFLYRWYCVINHRYCIGHSLPPGQTSWPRQWHALGAGRSRALRLSTLQSSPLAGEDGEYLSSEGRAEQSEGRDKRRGKERAQNEPGHWEHTRVLSPFSNTFYPKAPRIFS